MFENTCTLCYKLLCCKITLIFYRWFYISLICSYPLVEQNVSLALETWLGGKFVGSGENFPRLFAYKSFLLSDVWPQIYYSVFDHRITIVHRFECMQFPTTRKSHVHCNVFFFFIFLIRSYGLYVLLKWMC